MTRWMLTAARSHNQTFQRREAHGGIDTFASLDRGYGRAVAKVAGDDL